jgi:threonine dehydrogenase-like Zn-dependent dehydrogenase
VLPAKSTFELPEDVPLEHAALLEPIVACAGAIRSAGLSFGSSVLIAGAGRWGCCWCNWPDAVARRGYS